MRLADDIHIIAITRAEREEADDLQPSEEAEQPLEKPLKEARTTENIETDQVKE